MAFNVQFYQLNKRENSTLQPSGVYVSYAGTLKEGSSIVTPVISLNVGNGANSITSYNYCYIADFGRYYFITDWAWNAGWWEFSAVVDVLATYKTNIQNTTAFIQYAETAYNTLIVDTRLQQVSYTTYHESTGNADIFSNTGSYVLQFVSSGGTETVGGAAATFVITRFQLATLTANLFAGGLDSVWEQLTAQAGSAANCIISCVYLPFIDSDLDIGGLTAVKLGSWDAGVTGLPVRGRYINKYTQVTIPWQHSDFRRLYSDIVVNLPFVGAVNVSASEVLNDSSIYVIMKCDIVTGNMIYYLCHATEAVEPFATYSGNCAIQIPVTAYQNNISQSLGGVLQVAGGVMSGNILAGGAGLVNAAYGFMSKTPSVIGGNSGAVNMSNRVQIVLADHPTSIEPSSVSGSIGRPYFAQNSLGGFSGRIQTYGFSVSGNMTDNERTKINTMLDNGIFIE